MTFKGSDVVSTIATFVQEYGITHILMGRTQRPWYRRWFGQSPLDRYSGGYATREYAHRVLDIFTVFFLVRFTKKPLRFFGMLGASTFVIGALLVAWLAIDRLVFLHPLADRPALLLSSLLVVLGMQLFALGLLGELIIFTHARDIKDYQIDEVVRYPEAVVPDDGAALARAEKADTTHSHAA